MSSNWNFSSPSTNQTTSNNNFFEGQSYGLSNQNHHIWCSSPLSSFNVQSSSSTGFSSINPGSFQFDSPRTSTLSFERIYEDLIQPNQSNSMSYQNIPIQYGGCEHLFQNHQSYYPQFNQQYITQSSHNFSTTQHNLDNPNTLSSQPSQHETNQSNQHSNTQQNTTITFVDGFTRIKQKRGRPPSTENKLKNIIDNADLNFSQYKLQGDAVIKLKNKSFAICNSLHFNIANPSIDKMQKEFHQFEKETKSNGKLLLTCKKGSEKTTKSMIEQDKSQYTKSKLGSLLCGIELLLYNNGISNFSEFFDLLIDMFPDIVYRTLSKRKDYDDIDTKVRKLVTNKKIPEYDSYIEMYLNKQEKTNPIAINDYPNDLDDPVSSEISSEIDENFDEYEEHQSSEAINETTSTISQEEPVSSSVALQTSSNDDDEMDWEDDDYSQSDASSSSEETNQRKKVTKRKLRVVRKKLLDIQAKDKAKISNTQYKELVSSSSSKTTPLSSMSSVQSVVSIKALIEFKGTHEKNENIFFISLYSLVKYMIELYVQWVKQISTDKELAAHLNEEDKNWKTKIKWFKLNLDGSKGRVTFACAPLNMKNFGSPQSREAVHPVAVWKGKENQLRAITGIIRVMIESMTCHGVDVDGVNHKVDFCVTTDLLSLKRISNLKFSQMCPYCNTLNTFCDHFHLARSKEQLGCLLGVSPFKIVICLLHMKERIMERILIDAIMTSNKRETIVRIIRKIPNLNNFKITEKGQKLKCYLTGKQVNSILSNLRRLRKVIVPQYITLMSKFRNVLKLLQNESFSESELNNLQLKLNEMEEVVQSLYTDSGSQSWYMHILFHHVIPLIKVYGNLVHFETQGFEGAHIDDERRMKNTSNNGGKYNYLDRMFPTCKDQSLIQFMLPKIRRLMVCRDLKIPFQNRQRNNEKYKQFLAIPYPIFSFQEENVALLSFVPGKSLSEVCTRCEDHEEHEITSKYDPISNVQYGKDNANDNDDESDAMNMFSQSCDV
ncbi:hypothetical protein C9374_003738 [Naegleria lovaniensis]|uniref:Uncharacterized protein n=1 Tax=Naegleria lovaniensis TaxID=51637 RepID=A0AA88GEQ7_NAELO|nr:uncharacterized protein C9374_012362 [Naegleria lovaniensis]XP_044544409.1 uncharacterized protein C9374_009858 [Naegleria lovaniensis]XP_044546213.1 uncharacterized protein C9374_007589 [Naegleria lovaniensis]XP_044551838.1 uncharacterized protein C9374_001440 [Naegleria lovaniensis]XP_044551873.1 uncharacterized protein C9374_001475 [Naegleria lovaniensis]XP_044552375.1 uncharacterized protein C9374_000547 [Naegleria lovaniensis]XP_044555868.1 uncharacterized protein C9374_003738 [Naegle